MQEKFLSICNNFVSEGENECGCSCCSITRMLVLRCGETQFPGLHTGLLLPEEPQPAAEAESGGAGGSLSRHLQTNPVRRDGDLQHPAQPRPLLPARHRPVPVRSVGGGAGSRQEHVGGDAGRSGERGHWRAGQAAVQVSLLMILSPLCQCLLKARIVSHNGQCE